MRARVLEAKCKLLFVVIGLLLWMFFTRKVVLDSKVYKEKSRTDGLLLSLSLVTCTRLLLSCLLSSLHTLGELFSVGKLFEHPEIQSVFFFLSQKINLEEKK